MKKTKTPKKAKKETTVNSCKKCGKCCVDAFLNLWEITEENRDILMDRANWLFYHRCDPIITKQDGKEFLALSIPLTCKHLSYKHGDYSCKIYDKRPEICRRYNCQDYKKLK